MMPNSAGLPMQDRCSAPAIAAALAIDAVSHHYGSRCALKDVSLEVAPGSFTALLGLNGAGKSTLVSLVTRLFGVQRGISAFSATIPAVSPARRCAGSASCSSHARWISTCR